MKDKTHYRKAFDSPYLSSADIVEPIVLTISHVVLESDKTKKTQDRFNTAYFKEKQIRPNEKLKPMILNATNSKVIKKISGSSFIEDWQNLAVMIEVEHVKFGREYVEGLRIYPAITQKKTLTSTQVEMWEKAKQSYINNGSLDKVLAHVEMSPEDQERLKQECANAMQWHDVEQNTEAWDALRLGNVTASQFSCFMANQGKAFGEPAKRYALQIALEIITGKKSEFSFTNDHMLRGHEQEPIARRLYEETNFFDVTNGGFFDCCNYGDSPDGLVGNDGVIEIKSVTAAVHFETLKRKTFDPAYKWQLIGHLDCTIRDWVDFVSYCTDFPEYRKLISHRLYRKDYEEEIHQLQARRKVFLNLVATTCNGLC